MKWSALILAALFATTASAQQQVPCGPRAEAIANLESKYGEVRQSAGLSARGALIEVYANDETGTWTIAASLPDGRMCLLDAGESFRRDDKASGRKS